MPGALAGTSVKHVHPNLYTASTKPKTCVDGRGITGLKQAEEARSSGWLRLLVQPVRRDHITT
jgi:hypothetical protein